MRSLRPLLPHAWLAAQAAAAWSEPAAAQGADPPAQAPVVVTLADVERAAMARQPQILIARAATGVARALAEQARAPLLPQVTGSATYTRRTNNFPPGQYPGVTGANWSLSTSVDAWNFGVAANQLIYDFGQSYQRYRAADSNAEAQLFAEGSTRLQVLLTVRRAYFGARAAKELVDVARETLADQDRHLVQVRAYVEVGTQPPIALAQQRASVANAQVQLITAQNGYETAKAQLNQASGNAGGTDYDVTDDELPPVADEDEPLEALVSKALSARPEMTTLREQRRAQEQTLGSARGGYGPTLSAAAGATYAGNQLASDHMVPNWNAGLVLTWPVLQGGLTTGEVHQAEAGLASVDAQLQLEALQVRLDVDSARLAVRAAKATIGAAQDALASARDQLHLAEQRFATGVGNIIELTDAQVSYTSAAAQVVQARFGLSSARAQLLAALGRM
ncbi:MAG TPA: TolC family protein [Polyangiaceae bacterium]|nr:TolC family protein [Polyangiaceae bacterium]